MRIKRSANVTNPGKHKLSPGPLSKDTEVDDLQQEPLAGAVKRKEEGILGSVERQGAPEKDFWQHATAFESYVPLQVNPKIQPIQLLELC